MSFLSEFSLTFSAQLATLVINLLTNVLLSRMVGASGWGTYALVITTSGVLCLIFGLGLQWANTYLTGKDSANAPVLFSNSLMVSLVVGFGLGIAYLAGYNLFSQYIRGLDRLLVAIVVASVPLTLIWQNNRAIVLGLRRITDFNVINLSQGAVFISGLVTAFFFFPLQVTGVAMLWLSTIGIAVVTSVLILRKRVRIRLLFRPAFFRQTVRVALRASLMDSLRFLLFRADLYLVALFLTSEYVGYYFTAVLVAELMMRVPNVAAALLFPRAVGDSAEESTALVTALSRHVVFFSVLASIFLWLFGRPIITVAFGSEFFRSYSVLLWLLPGIVAQGLNTVISRYIAGSEGFPRVNLIAPAVALSTNIALDLVLIPRVGLVGAAVSSSLSYIILCSIHLWYLLSRRGIRLAELVVIRASDLRVYGTTPSRLWLKLRSSDQHQ